MIKLCTDHRTNNQIYIQISEQNEKEIYFNASNGLELRTECYPEIRKNVKTFYLRGTEEKSNNNKMHVSHETFVEISEAVNEYNEKCKKEKEIYVIYEKDDIEYDTKTFNSFEKAEKFIKNNIKRNFSGYIYKRVATVDIKETKKIDINIAKL